MSQKIEASIQFGNSEMLSSILGVFSITASMEVNKIAAARIIIQDGDVAKQDFERSNKDIFKPGTEVTISMGTPDEKEKIFEGIIIKHSIKIKQGRSSVLILECRDKAVQLSIDCKNRFFKDKTDNEIFTEILKDYNEVDISQEDDEKNHIHEQVTQYQCTDWDFINLRSEAIGKYVFNEGGKIDIKKPDLTAESVRTLEYGRQGDVKNHSIIWEFESEIDARYQYDEVIVSAWNSSSQDVTEGKADINIENKAGNLSSNELTEVIGVKNYRLQHLGHIPSPEVVQYANSIKQKSSLNKIYGRVKIEGHINADIKPGDMVKLVGVGERYNGNVFVSRVHHSFTPGRWFTELLIGLPNEWFAEKPKIQKPPALGMVAAVNGIHIGKVVSLEKENEDFNSRVKVNIPGIHVGDNDGLYARMAMIQAGSDTGAMFFPNVGDEVLIGYLEQDPRKPVVLGMVYSENNKPPFKLTDNNFIKGWTTKSGTKIIVDEEKGDVTIASKGNQIFLNEGAGSIEIQDKNSNTIEMSSSGVSINSNTSIKLNAKTIDITATALVKIDGMPIKLGTGTRPAAGLGDPTPAGGPIGPAVTNAKVLI